MKKKFIAITLTLAALIGALTLPSCQKQPERYTDYSFDYFDTATTIIGYANTRADFNAVASYVKEQLSEYHRLYTIYHRYEDLENLCTINELSNGAHRTVKADVRILDMLEFSRDAYELTMGKVNIAMGSVLSIWHDYREAGSDEPWNAALPPMERLQEAALHTDIASLVIDRENMTVTLTDDAARLDVGAVAKGYAVEMIARSLEERGVSGYVLNVGGNVRTVGKKPDGEGWTVGIEDPQKKSESGYLEYLVLSSEALVTSGSYQRYYTVDGVDYHHIIDPDTLLPADYFLSVSV
ncbi:MAG: FAD:protein FMN transferase, partial [Clostridia bacterium]|nr:FAD:protein FMN transferase [Clostridia bacterium]